MGSRALSRVDAHTSLAAQPSRRLGDSAAAPEQSGAEGGLLALASKVPRPERSPARWRRRPGSGRAPVERDARLSRSGFPRRRFGPDTRGSGNTRRPPPEPPPAPGALELGPRQGLDSGPTHAGPMSPTPGR